jgi:hypothetical protein
MPIITIACRCDRCSKRENTTEEGYGYPKGWDTFYLFSVTRLLCGECLEALKKWLEEKE